MIALDTNILVYSHRADSLFHAKAFRIVKDLAEGGKPWTIPWPCLHEFYSIVTGPKIYKPPTQAEKAIDQIEGWLESSLFEAIGEDIDHWSQLKKILLTSRIAGPTIHDARIAAICISHGVTELWSADRDFSRIPGLKITNPLVSL